MEAGEPRPPGKKGRGCSSYPKSPDEMSVLDRRGKRPRNEKTGTPEPVSGVPVVASSDGLLYRPIFTTNRMETAFPACILRFVS